MGVKGIPPLGCLPPGERGGKVTLITASYNYRRLKKGQSELFFIARQAHQIIIMFFVDIRNYDAK